MYVIHEMTLFSCNDIPNANMYTNHRTNLVGLILVQLPSKCKDSKHFQLQQLRQCKQQLQLLFQMQRKQELFQLKLPNIQHSHPSLKQILFGKLLINVDGIQI